MLGERRAGRAGDERQEGELGRACLARAPRSAPCARRTDRGHVDVDLGRHVRRGLPRADHVLGDRLPHPGRRDDLVRHVVVAARAAPGAGSPPGVRRAAAAPAEERPAAAAASTSALRIRPRGPMPATEPGRPRAPLPPASRPAKRAARRRPEAGRRASAAADGSNAPCSSRPAGRPRPRSRPWPGGGRRAPGSDLGSARSSSAQARPASPTSRPRPRPSHRRSSRQRRADRDRLARPRPRSSSASPSAGATTSVSTLSVAISQITSLGRNLVADLPCATRSPSPPRPRRPCAASGSRCRSPPAHAATVRPGP